MFTCLLKCLMPFVGSSHENFYKHRIYTSVVYLFPTTSFSLYNCELGDMRISFHQTTQYIGVTDNVIPTKVVCDLTFPCRIGLTFDD